jgi:hypothetical protein
MSQNLPLNTASPEELALAWFSSHDLGQAPGLSVPLIDADAVVLAQLEVDREIARVALEAKLGSGKAQRLQRIADLLTSRVHDEVAVGSFDTTAVLGELSLEWTAQQQQLFLIELLSTTPFSPYEVRTSPGKQREGLRHAAKVAGAFSRFNEVLASTEAARKAHTKTDWARAGVFGLGAAVVMGTGGLLAAPAVGTALGSAAGLSGAAATSHGLALLGGGSLASGGMGMSGGLWMVTSAAAATGGSLSNAGLALHRMGAKQYRHELVKLQVSYDLLLSKNTEHTPVAQAVSAQLATQVTELTSQLDEERELNDANSQRVRELADKLRAVKAAINWTEEIDGEPPAP